MEMVMSGTIDLHFIALNGVHAAIHELHESEVGGHVETREKQTMIRLGTLEKYKAFSNDFCIALPLSPTAHSNPQPQTQTRAEVKQASQPASPSNLCQCSKLINTQCTDDVPLDGTLYKANSNIVPMLKSS